MNTSDNPEISVKVRHKRVITEARKQQNRIASRVYRQKKSASVEEKKLKPTNLGVTTRRKLVPKPQKCPAPRADEITSTVPTNPPVLGSQTPKTNFLDDQTFAQTSFYETSPLLEVTDHTPELQTEILDSGDIVALLSCAYTFLSAMNPTGSGVRFTPEDVTMAGSCLDTLLSRETPRIASEPRVGDVPPGFLSQISDSSIFSSSNQALVPNTQTSHFAMPDPYLNNLRNPHLSLLTAILYNSRCLDIKLERVMTPYFDSPFYRPTNPSDDPSQLLASAKNPSFPAHLQPTLPQILFPHHAFLDLIPLPVLRARAIAWAATTPAIFSPMDLKRDIVDDGLRCWHEMGTGAGNGQPWDMSSWEFTPWFLDKWRMLIFS